MERRLAANRLDLQFEDMGEHELKNIDRLIRVSSQRGHLSDRITPHTCSELGAAWSTGGGPSGSGNVHGEQSAFYD